ncbi:MAG: nitronate monooxygenase [Chloroflexi bacterium]|nr:nitronate monooxygenase [Chloroflexota bacterium]
MAISLHTKLCDMLGIEYPIMAFNHCRDVVAAVSNAGGCGVLGAIALTPEQITAEFGWMKAHTDKPFGIDLVFPANTPDIATKEELLSYVPKEYRNFVDKVKKELGLPEQIYSGNALELGVGGTHEWQRKQLDAALKMKPPVMAAALGFNREVVEECHAAGVKIITLVGNVKTARRAAAAGVDIIVAQGTEAGGHTGRIGTLALVPQVVDAVSPVPVLAAGGIGDGRGLVAALALGAVGVWTGTIWLTCHESPLADYVKDRILESTDEDAVITKIYTGKTARTLNNKYIERWKQPDAPPTLPMPLQNFYSAMPHMVSTEDPRSLAMFDKPGMRDWASAPAGNIVGMIRQRKSARQIVYDMVSQAVEILGTD